MKQILEISILSLKRRKKEAVMILLGVVISAFFITCAVVLGTSFVNSSRQNNISIYGEQVLITQPINKNSKDTILSDSFWKKKGFVLSTGAVSPKQGDNEIAIGFMDSTAFSLSHLKISSGRLPIKEGEITIEENFATRAGLEENIEIGSTIKIKVHKISSLYEDANIEGTNIEETNIEEADLEGVNLVDTNSATSEYEEQSVDKSYTVVGFIKNNSSIRILDLQSTSNSLPGKIYLPLSALVSEQEAMSCDDIRESAFLYSNEKSVSIINTHLPQNLMYAPNYQAYASELDLGSVDVFRSRTKMLVNAIVAILLAATVLFVFTIFSVSIDTNKQKYALIRCIGSTRHQAFWLVVSEGVFLALCGVLVGSLAGISVSALIIVLFSHMIEGLNMFPISFCIQPASVLVAGSLVLIASLVAIMIPAIRAGRQSLVENIVIGGKKRRKKEMDKKAAERYSATYFIRRSLRGKVVRTIIYLGCFALCISMINILAFYVNMQISRQNSYRSSDFYLGSYGYGYQEGEFEYDKIETKEIDKSIIHALRQEKGVQSVVTEIFPVMYTYFSRSKYSDFYSGDQWMFQNEGDEIRYTPRVFTYDKKDLLELRTKVIEGSINETELREGKEIILCLPSYYTHPDYPYKFLAYGEYFYPLGATLHKNTTFHAGDTLTFITNPSNSKKSKKIHVKIGAIVNDKDTMNIIMFDGVQDKLEIPWYLQMCSVYMEKDTDLVAAESRFLNISNNYATTFHSGLEEAKRVKSEITFYCLAGGFAVALLSVIGFAIFLHATIMRFHNRVAELSLLRVTGMTARQCKRQSILEGALYGVIICVFSFIGMFITLNKVEPHRWQYYVSWPLILVCMAMSIILSIFILYLCVSKTLGKTRIIEKIRN